MKTIGIIGGIGPESTIEYYRLLGGTELPLILRGVADQKIPFLDTTAIHVEQVVAQMLSEEAA